MGIIMSGLDYQKAPIALREQLSFTKTQAGALTGRLAQGEGILGCVLLSTCNRTELYLSCPPEGRAAPDRLLCRAVGLDPGPFAGAFVTRRGEEAVRHLMEVAGGLQSQIWGEDQILSQVKEAIAIAREQGAADPVLETLFRTAVSAGKEIKTKVRLTGVAVSAAARAVEVLRRDLGDLQGRRALVIGNGEMGRLSAALLREAGCAVTVTLRTYRHGETVVPAGCAVTPYGERYASMEGMDILLSATTSPHYTVSARQMSMLKARPSWVVDLAMPRDVDPAAGDLPGVTLYNVDTLGAEQRRGALPQTVTDILDSHMEQLPPVPPRHRGPEGGHRPAGAHLPRAGGGPGGGGAGGAGGEPGGGPAHRGAQGAHPAGGPGAVRGENPGPHRSQGPEGGQTCAHPIFPCLLTCGESPASSWGAGPSPGAGQRS